MKKILTLLFLGIIFSASSQNYKKSEFDKGLLQVKNKDTLQKLQDKILAIEQQINTNDTLITIKDSSKWKLICYTENGWNEVVGRPRTIIDYKFIQETPSIKNSVEVFDVFNQNFNIANIKKQYPFVLDREDVFNRKLVPILINNKYLVFRYVHSYPNGNQTSWYNVNTYYFEKLGN